MSVKCKLGFHTWDCCKCTECGKIRDEQHNWTKDCGKCSKCNSIREDYHHNWIQNCERCFKCGKTKENEHDWSKDCEKCSKCGKTEENQHDWTKDCERCSKCSTTKNNQHDWNGCICSKCGKEEHSWTTDCEICSECTATREDAHDWTKDCTICCICGKTHELEHIWDRCVCSKCKKNRNEFHDIMQNGFCSICSDKLEYKAVQIGNQIWMAENLNVSHYQNGDSITEERSFDRWKSLKSGAYCYYENNNNYGEKYGKFYNWYAVNDPRGLAPQGWHIASDDEWKQLEMFLGMSDSEVNKSDKGRGTIEAFKLKKPGWDSVPGLEQVEKEQASILNESGFSALPGGTRDHGDFFQRGIQASFWSSSEENENSAWKRELFVVGQIYRGNHPKYYGFSVRCIKDLQAK